MIGHGPLRRRVQPQHAALVIDAHHRAMRHLGPGFEAAGTGDQPAPVAALHDAHFMLQSGDLERIARFRGKLLEHHPGHIAADGDIQPVAPDVVDDGLRIVAHFVAGDSALLLPTSGQHHTDIGVPVPAPDMGFLHPEGLEQGKVLGTIGGGFAFNRSDDGGAVGLRVGHVRVSAVGCGERSMHFDPPRR